MGSRYYLCCHESMQGSCRPLVGVDKRKSFIQFSFIARMVHLNSRFPYGRQEDDKD